ncbi:MAG TPA: DHA2 family efflux MFS transporter permease subunit [Syntrophorhabdus sp.]|jgi:DHA2 family multidrug resistance protein|nr:DHA2 family efflux MFS transporter permease subunit [Syntrophorhabdus sp.]MDI9557433.1 DHA2 family efflux MFS transporter permease subunit [Pseudomonadota bacterium]OPX95624.1 MAG: Multidrug export protein EmrB [Syntrophorhabdus sp. PtaB.Bin027]OQB77001.1 MAG: Multidrug export protein EmrB [Deltaproteobacteria bacterium ADurb.Bin135]MBP8743571.1 DHA2 family efflux MFS transporter permease subunit [Syntrophorhabdus sp.]
MNRWLVAVTVMLPTLIEIIDMSVVNVALDHIRGSLSAGIDEATWAITMYLVSNAIIIPITGWLSRYFGRKVYLTFSIALFTVSSLLCGMAWNIQSLIVFRIFQGLGGGALQPISQSILLETFPPRLHGVAMAVFGIGIMFGPIAGPVLGGVITDYWSWHWIFFINIPVGIISIFMTMLVIKDPPYMKKTRMKLDYPGLLLVALGLGCLQIILDRGQREDWFESSMISWLTIISVVSLALFLIVELRTKEPVIDLRVFRNISFATGNVIMFFAFFNLFGSIVLLPIYLQTLMGYTATLAGLVLGPGGFSSIIALSIAGRLVTRINPKWILAFGISTAALSTYMMSQFNLSADFITVMWPRIILGFGMGFIFIPLTNLSLSIIKKEGMGNATALFNLIRNLGGSFGIAFVSTVLARRAQFHQSNLVSHLTPFDMPYQIAVEKLKAFFHTLGFTDTMAKMAADGSIYRNLIKQASMIAFNDTFWLMSIMLVATLPLLLIFKRPRHGEHMETM